MARGQEASKDLLMLMQRPLAIRAARQAVSLHASYSLGSEATSADLRDSDFGEKAIW